MLSVWQPIDGRIVAVLQVLYNDLCHHLIIKIIIIISLILGVTNVHQQFGKFPTLFMQLNSTSTSDSNADRQAYIYVSDTEKRLQKSVDDIKEIIRDSTLRTQDSFKSMNDVMTKMEGNLKADMTKMEGKIEKIEEKIDKIKEEFLVVKITQVVVFLILATIQPDVRSFISTIIGFIKVWVKYEKEFITW